MILKKPKFWDYKKPNIYALILFPLAFLINQFSYFNLNNHKKKFKIKTICIGNIYLGGTGKTTLSIKINKLLNMKGIKSCLIKKYYKNQIDEQRLLKNYGKLFVSKKRTEALNKAENNNYEIAIFDDGLQDKSINYDIKFVCFNNINWIGNGLTIPAGPLREKFSNIKKYKHLFLIGNDENLNEIKNQIYKVNPSIEIHYAKYIPTNISEFKENENYIVFSGIGNHQTFLSMIKLYGLNVLKDFQYPDHYNYKDNDLKKILEHAKKLNCKIITTEKDYFRINVQYLDKIKFIKTELKIFDEDKLINSIYKT